MTAINPAPRAAHKAGSLVLLVSPSGAGKTTLSKAVRQRLGAVGGDFGKIVTHTTRAPRAGERDGVHYHFVTDTQFDAMRASGEFAETAQVFGRQYGTSHRAIADVVGNGQDAMLVIDVQGAASIKAQMPDAIYVFILPPSIEALRTRLRERGQDSEHEIARRLSGATQELARWQEADYVIVNDDLQTATDDLSAIVRTHHIQAHRQDHSELVRDLLASAGHKAG